MLDYVLHFYNNYTIVFYLLVIFVAIIEWPIIIFGLSLMAWKIWISFISLYLISFFWDFVWDMLHYFFWRFLAKKLENKKDYSLIEKFNKQLEGHSLFDKLLVIKYTPPITSIWLFYLWYKERDILKFAKNDALIVWFNSLIITFIWYNFWNLFVNDKDFVWFLMWFFFSAVVFYIIIKFLAKFIINKIYNGKNT